MVQTSCALCNSKDNFKVLYKSNFSNEDLSVKVFSARRVPDGSHYQIVRCNKDGMVRSNPISEPEVITSLYKDSKFTYENEVDNLEKSYMEVLNPWLSKLSNQDNILEIGCGNGFILRRIYEKGFKNCYGIEPSIEAKSKADERIKENIVVSILKKGIFKNKKFKFIFFFQTLDHIPDPDKFIKDCYDLLDEGGYILAFNHNVESLSARILGEKSVIIDIEHIFLFSPNTIRMIFEKNNFKPLKVFSPFNVVSLKYLIHLLPMPLIIKKLLQALAPRGVNLKLQLGNLCIIAQK